MTFIIFGRKRHLRLGLIALGLTFFMLLPFVRYAWVWLAGIHARPDRGLMHLYKWRGGGLPDVGIFGHMMLGALVTLFAPLQLMPSLRRRWPGVHRATGYLLITAPMLTALGGLVYIAVRGTIGGRRWEVGLAYMALV